MTDHVTRMVQGWLHAHLPRGATETRAVLSLVDAIHRLIREAEDETRRRSDSNRGSSPST
jgi:hypothetical protein